MSSIASKSTNVFMGALTLDKFTANALSYETVKPINLHWSSNVNKTSLYEDQLVNNIGISAF